MNNSHHFHPFTTTVTIIGYGWGNVCYIVDFSPGKYLLYSKVSGGGEGLLNSKYSEGECLLYSKHSGGSFAMRKVCYTTPAVIIKNENWDTIIQASISNFCLTIYFLSIPSSFPLIIQQFANT